MLFVNFTDDDHLVAETRWRQQISTLGTVYEPQMFSDGVS
jgi:hypothetical protein